MNTTPIPGRTTSLGMMARRSRLSFLSKLLPLLLLLALPVVAQAQFDYTVDNDTITITKYTGPGGEVVIPETINGLPVKAIGDGAFRYSACTSVTIPDSVTSLGRAAFSNCTNLTAVSIGNGVTSIGTAHEFSSTALISVTIGNSVTTITQGAFYSGNLLMTITVDALNPVFSSADGVLYDKTQTTLLKCPQGRSGNFTIPDSVTSISEMAFRGCRELTSVAIPDSVTDIKSHAFSGCKGLIGVTIPDSVISIGAYAFEECTRLTAVVFGRGITRIGDTAFWYCVSLIAIYFEGDAPKLGEQVFYVTETTVYYLPGTSGWGPTFGSLPTAPWNGEHSPFHYDIKDGMITLKGYTGLGSELIIPEIISGLPVISIGSGAFSDRPLLTRVTIPNSITNIEWYAFWDCSGLTEVTIGQNVLNIGETAFAGCTSLTSVTIPDSVTSVGITAFSGCAALEVCTIGSGVTNIGGGAFSGCTGLTAITIDDLNPVYSSLDGVLFDKGRTTLIQFPPGRVGSYTIPDSVTSIEGSALEKCNDLTSVTIPNSVTSIGSYAFSQCTNLTSVMIGNGVNTIESHAFADCSGLSAVYFQGDAPVLQGEHFFSGTSASIYYMPWTSGWGPEFGGLPTIVWNVEQVPFNYTISNGAVTITKYTGAGGDLIIPGMINGLSVTGIGYAAFYGCTGLTSVTIPHSVIGIGDSVFAHCTSLNAIDVDPLNPAYSSLDGLLFDKSESTLIQYPVGKSGSYVVPDHVGTIGSGAFAGCFGLSSIELGDSVISLGWGAFEYCTSLTTVTIPDSVTNIGPAAFYECPNLITVSIGNGVTSIGPLAFYNCSSLTSIVIPDSVTSLGSDGFIGCTSLSSVIIGNGVTSIEEHMFQNCTSLMSITIPNSITSIGQGVFYNCSSLTSITIPDSVSLIEEGAFSSCTRLTEITVESLNPVYESLDGVLFDKSQTALIQCPGGRQGGYTIPSSVSIIGDGAFNGCTQLTGVTIPNSITSIGSLAFGHCTGLTSMTIPDSVTVISVGTFAGCTALTNITIPYSVVSIGSRAFHDCTNLSAVFFDGDAPELEGDALKGTTATVYYFPGTFGWGSTFGGLPTAVRNVDPVPFEYTISDGTVTITKYQGQVGYVVIPDAINGQPVSRIGDEAFSSCESLAFIVIPNSVTSIGRKAFHQCAKLISIWISRNVTVIGDYAFGQCASLTAITVEDSNPVYKSVGGVLLDRNLTTLIRCPGGLAGSYTVPDSVTTIGAAAFADCRNLTEVYFEGDVPALGDGVFDGTTVLVLYPEGTLGWESTFGGMSTASWVKEFHFDYIIDDGKATIIRYTGSSGGDVIIPSSLNGVPVTGIGEYAFEWRADLTGITIPDSITSIAHSAFLGCYGLTTIRISENVTSIGTNPFAWCWGLTAITVEALNPAYCSLEGVLFNKDQTTLIQCPPAGKSGSYTIPSSVTSIGDNAFERCRELTSVTIPDRVTSIGSDAFADCTSLTSGTIPDGVTSIGTAAFYGCTNLISVTIPDSVTSIGAVVFYDCMNLTSANIPNSVTEVSYGMFAHCYRLASITIPAGITRIGDFAFEGCGSLTSLAIPEGVTSIGEEGFSFCGGLTSITIPKSVSLIEDGAFTWCTGLTSITIPSSVGLIEPYAFASCTRLTTITVDSLNPAYCSLDGVLFDKNHSTLLQCPGGKAGSYTIPDGVSTIGQGSFGGCTQLSSITIPASVSTIGPGAFGGCTALTNITIPFSVISIGSSAFHDCANLSAVYFDGDAPELDSFVFERTTPTIYYYPWTSGWGSTFGGRPTMPCGLTRGDLDGDGDLDRDDLVLIVAARNTAALGPEDPRDLDGDGRITVLDARILVTLFSVPGGLIHATANAEGVVLYWAQSTGAVKLQSTTDLEGGHWQDVGGLQSPTNAVIDTTAECMFFRLVLPE